MVEPETNKSKKRTKRVHIKNDIIEEKTKAEIEDDVDKIIFPNFICPPNIEVSNAIMNGFDGTGQIFSDDDINFMNKVIPFMYSDFLYSQNPRLPLPMVGYDKSIKSYVLDLQNKMRYALGIPKKLKFLDDLMEVIDGPGQNIRNHLNNFYQQANNLGAVDENAWKYSLPRYKKYVRLRNMYKIVVNFALTLINEFYWYNILDYANPVRQDNAMSVYNLDHYTKKVMPIVIRLMKELEDQVNEEFPPDLIDGVIRDVKP